MKRFALLFALAFLLAIPGAAQTLATGQITTNGGSVTLMTAPGTIELTAFSVSVATQLTGCTTSPQVWLTVGGIGGVAGVTMSNYGSGWYATSGLPVTAFAGQTIVAFMTIPGVGCTGLLPVTASITWQVSQPILQYSPSSLSFAPVYPGNSSPPQVVTLSSPPSNPGVQFYSIGVDDGADFGVVYPGLGTPCNSQGGVSPGGSCTITVVFHPASPGLKSGNLIVMNNDPTKPTLEIPLSEQNNDWTYIIAHNIEDASGNLMPSGTLCVVGSPTSNFTAGGGGTITSKPACVPVATGAIVDGSLRVPDSASTGPLNITYAITATDRTTGKVVLQFNGVYISGPAWVLDTYVPSPNVIPLRYGFRLRGAYNPTTQYQTNDVVSCAAAQGCTVAPGSYIANQPTLGQTPDVSPTAWQALGLMGPPGGDEFSIDLDTPLTTDSPQHKLGHNFTFQRISCYAASADGTATVTINLDVRTEAAPGTAGSNVLATPLVCDGTGTSVATSFAFPSGLANAPIALDVVATSGTPTMLNVHVVTN